MALWGNLDSKGSGGTVSLNGLTVTGSGTTFGQVGAASTGDIIRFGDISGTYYGDAIIVGIASTTQLTIASASNLSGLGITNVPFTISQLPKFTTLDSHYKVGVNTSYDALVYGVSEDESQVNSTTSFDLTHAGWVGVTTYLDWDGNLRVKSEVLVAMSSIEGDNSEDDIVLPDAKITILSQPSNLTGVGSTATVTFNVTATVVPTQTLTYEWRRSTNNVAFTTVTNGGIYSGATTNTLSIANTNTSINGNYFKVYISAGDVSKVSTAASITFAS